MIYDKYAHVDKGEISSPSRFFYIEDFETPHRIKVFGLLFVFSQVSNLLSILRS